MQLNNKQGPKAKRRQAIDLREPETLGTLSCFALLNEDTYATKIPSNAADAKKTRRVRFDTVDIRFYERIVLPCSECVAMISIGWRFVPGLTLSINEYEEGKPGTRKKAEQLVMTQRDRRNLLIKWGAAYSDIVGEGKVKSRRMSNEKSGRTNPLQLKRSMPLHETRALVLRATHLFDQ
jgi:hypothetical protein